MAPTALNHIAVITVLAVSVMATRVQADEASDGIRKKLIGTWDSSPTLELEFLRANPNISEAYERGRLLGNRLIYKFNEDGTIRITQFLRSGAEDGVSLGRLVATVTQSKWELSFKDPKTPRIRITPKDGESYEAPIHFVSENEMTLECHDFSGIPYVTPFTFRRNVGVQAIRWLVQNSKAKRESDLVQDLGKFISKCTNEHKDFTLRFSGDLLKSGRPTQIDAYYEQFFVSELTDEHAKQFQLTPGKISTISPSRPLTFLTLAGCKASALSIDAADHLDLSKPITGSVTIDTNDLNPRQGQDGDIFNYAVHLRMVLADAVVDHYVNLQNATHSGPIPFQVRMSERYKGYTGPVVIFADVCYKLKLSDGTEAVQILSSAVKCAGQAESAK